MEHLQYTSALCDENGNITHKITITSEFYKPINEGTAAELIGKALALFLNEVRKKNNE